MILHFSNFLEIFNLILNYFQNIHNSLYNVLFHQSKWRPETSCWPTREKLNELNRHTTTQVLNKPKILEMHQWI